MTSARPVSSESGMPLATAFEKQARSAVTPKRSCAPPSASRNPVHISSKISSAPRAAHSRLSSTRKPSRGASNVVGSRITHAVSSSSAAAIESRSLYANVWVSAATSAGMPRSRSVTPMYQSCQPW